MVGESAEEALILFADATVGEIAKVKVDVVERADAPSCRTSAWTLVTGSRALATSERRRFDELIASHVVKLADRSAAEQRAFALDALDADLPAWLDKIALSATEKDFLFASHQADRGNVAAALERVLALPEDRYPTKDLLLLRCLGATLHDETARISTIRHLRRFPGRPVAQGLLSILDGTDVDEQVWLQAAAVILDRCPPEAEMSLPRAEAARFIKCLASGAGTPAGSNVLGGDVVTLTLCEASRGDGTPPSGLTVADLSGAPRALVDDAIDLGVLTVSPGDRADPLGRYLLARTDPSSLTHDDLVELDFGAEIARRAYLRADHAELAALPHTPEYERLQALDSARAGELDGVTARLDSFEGQDKGKLASVIGALRSGSLVEVTNEVLTDGTTWPVLARLLPEDTGELAAISGSRPALRGIAAWKTLSKGVSDLWAWDWDGALLEAKRCLQVTREVGTRDEALNLIACAQWCLGNDLEAISALRSALEIGHTEGLQVNIGVVAASLDPVLAGEHLGELASQAPTLALRCAAATRALSLWFEDPAPWDRAGEHALPTTLRDAIRALVRSQIPEPDFVRFARTLSNWDSTWLGEESNLADGPFAGTLVASVFQAKARDFIEFVTALAGATTGGEAPAWALEDRDSLVGAAIAGLNPENKAPMATSFALVLLDNGLQIAPGPFIDLVAFTVLGICGEIDPKEGEPKERFLDDLDSARPLVDYLPEGDRPRASELLGMATMRLAGSIVNARTIQHDQVVALFNNMNTQLMRVPANRINRSAVRENTKPAIGFLTDTARILSRVIAVVPDQEYRDALEGFLAQVKELRTAFKRLGGTQTRWLNDGTRT